MIGTLEKLLQRIRNGLADANDVARARELVAGDARLPEELRTIGLTDVNDLVGDAVGLLSVLGAAPLFGDDLREALLDEAVGAFGGESLEVSDDGNDAAWRKIAEVLHDGLVAASADVEVVQGVMARLPAPEWVYGPVTAEAVRAEAGAVDVAPEAMDALGSLLPAVAEAVRFEAGDVEVAGSVMAALGCEVLGVADAVLMGAGSVDIAGAALATVGAQGLLVAEAVHAEAGQVDVVGAIAMTLGFETIAVASAVTAEAGVVDVVDEVLANVDGSEASAPTEKGASTMPSSIEAPPTLPAPANRGWTWGVVALAAVALISVGLWQMPSATVPVSNEMQFAGAGELVVEELMFADDVVVMQTEGDEGAVILWMEDV